MKIKVIGSLFAIVVLAGIANAQRVKVVDGTRLIGLTPTSATGGAPAKPNLSSFAGQTVRIHMDAADASTAFVLIGTPPPVCTEDTPFTSPIAGTAVQNRGLLIVGVDTVELQVPTDPAWKGSCRVLSVRLRDGSEHIGRIFFE